MTPRDARSYLFVPGNRPDRFATAWRSGAEAVIIDLEDAVRDEEKPSARAAAADWLSPAHPVFVRVNGATTPWFHDDLDAVARPGLAGIMLPKATDRAQVAGVAACLPDAVHIIPLLETALGVWNAREVAEAPRVVRLAFGALDLQLDTGVEDDDLLYARSRVVLASRVAGLRSPIDSAATVIDDEARLRADVARARRLGFGGKLCVHPRQIAAIHQGFAPSAHAIAWATRVLAAAGATAEGAFRLDGEMIDRPVIERAMAIMRSTGATDAAFSEQER